MHLKKAPSPWHRDPLTWFPLKQGTTALIVCDNQHGWIISKHTIDNNGQVWPNVVCSEDGCEFNEFVTLDGWGRRNG